MAPILELTSLSAHDGNLISKLWIITWVITHYSCYVHRSALHSGLTERNMVQCMRTNPNKAPLGTTELVENPASKAPLPGSIPPRIESEIPASRTAFLPSQPSESHRLSSLQSAAEENDGNEEQQESAALLGDNQVRHTSMLAFIAALCTVHICGALKKQIWSPIAQQQSTGETLKLGLCMHYVCKHFHTSTPY